ncbi:MAG: hypothetical protein JXA98_02390 [Methanosarcinaceae archaeon]|nr:hypothetical protein [Methanosarcinaceae archaeon]
MNKIIVAAGVFVFILISCYAAIPLIFMGPPVPLFTVHNHDTTGHEVVVEVFDSNNESIIKETYVLDPKDDISRSRPVGLKLPWSGGGYTFKVTMDGKVTETSRMEIPDVYTMVNIRLYSKDYVSGETVLIYMVSVEKA